MDSAASHLLLLLRRDSQNGKNSLARLYILLKLTSLWSRLYSKKSLKHSFQMLWSISLNKSQHLFLWKQSKQSTILTQTTHNQLKTFSFPWWNTTKIVIWCIWEQWESMVMELSKVQTFLKVIARLSWTVIMFRNVRVNLLRLYIHITQVQYIIWPNALIT